MHLCVQMRYRQLVGDSDGGRLLDERSQALNPWSVITALPCITCFQDSSSNVCPIFVRWRGSEARCKSQGEYEALRERAADPERRLWVYWVEVVKSPSSIIVNPQCISHVIDVCSADLQPFCDRQRAAWNVKQWVLHLPAFVDTGWVRKTGNHHHLIGQCSVNAVASQVSRAHLGRLSRDQAEVFDAFMSQRPRRKWYLIAICHVILRVLACLK